ncbi:unnamed protein product [Schistosoma curassoni]|uniref:HEPN domain-containing protein n=1 Tax=Schistosoma curassoni TaxID=6186 RepID=A0A183JY55_9TREM|nr:unnamed protein product [Schistosoma curassoni]
MDLVKKLNKMALNYYDAYDYYYHESIILLNLISLYNPIIQSLDYYH